MTTAHLLYHCHACRTIYRHAEPVTKFLDPDGRATPAALLQLLRDNGYAPDATHECSPVMAGRAEAVGVEFVGGADEGQGVAS